MNTRQRFLVTTSVGNGVKWDFEKCEWPRDANVFDTLEAAKDAILKSYFTSVANILIQDFMDIDGVRFFANPKVLHMVIKGFIRGNTAYTYSSNFYTNASETDLYIQGEQYLSYSEAFEKRIN